MNDNKGPNADKAELLVELIQEIDGANPDVASRIIRTFCNDVLGALSENTFRHPDVAVLALELEVVLRRARGLPQA